MKGLYIADGSLMPTCAGINPMVSIMGLAHWIGQGME
jgi:choline dehydrogenase-like flavoprotein